METTAKKEKIETIIEDNIEPTRKYLLDCIVDKIKRKGWEQYVYGGYVFYPDGRVEKREASHTEIKNGCSPLIVNFTERTGVNPYQNKYNIDPYILALDCNEKIYANHQYLNDHWKNEIRKINEHWENQLKTLGVMVAPGDKSTEPPIKIIEDDNDDDDSSKK